MFFFFVLALEGNEFALTLPTPDDQSRLLGNQYAWSTRLRYCTRPFERNTRGTLGVCITQVANFFFLNGTLTQIVCAEHETQVLK